MIRTLKVGRKTLYVAKDVVAELGVKWHGLDTVKPHIKNDTSISYALVKCDDNIHRRHLMLDYQGLVSLQTNLTSTLEMVKDATKRLRKNREIEALANATNSVLRTKVRNLADRAADILNGSKITDRHSSSFHHGVYAGLYDDYLKKTGIDLIKLNKLDKQATGNAKQSVLAFAEKKGYIGTLLEVAKAKFDKVVNN